MNTKHSAYGARISDSSGRRISYISAGQQQCNSSSVIFLLSALNFNYLNYLIIDSNIFTALHTIFVLFLYHSVLKPFLNTFSNPKKKQTVNLPSNLGIRLLSPVTHFPVLMRILLISKKHMCLLAHTSKTVSACQV